MTFRKYKLFTRIEMPHFKYNSVLLDICHHYMDSCLFSKAFQKLSLNLNLSKNQWFDKISYSIEEYVAKHNWNSIIMFRYSSILFVYCFYVDYINIITIINSNIIQLLHFLWKSHSPRVRHPSHPGRGHGSLTFHMKQSERSDWMTSANVINVIIKYWANHAIAGSNHKIQNDIVWLDYGKIMLPQWSKTQ